MLPLMPCFRTLLVSLAAMLAPAAGAQVLLSPGHPDLVTDGLAISDQLALVRVAEPTAEDVGTTTTTVTTTDGRVTVETTADASDVGLGGAVTSTFAWPSLRPVETVRGEASRATYQGARMVGAYGRRGWEPLPYDITLDVEPFQPEVLPLIARALPLREGYVATVPTFSAGTRLREFTLAVTGRMPFVRADGTEQTVWVVEETSGLFGGRPRRYLIDGDTRDLVATTFAPQAGATVVIEPITEDALAARAAAATGGVPIRPGAAGLATEALTSYAREYAVRVIAPEALEAGTRSLAVTIDRSAGTITLRTVYDLTPVGAGRTVEDAVALFPSLQPVSRRTETRDGVSELAYSAAQVVTQSEGGSVEVLLPEPVFDEAFVPLVATVLPFEPGYQGLLATVGEDGPTTVQLTVVEPGEVAGRPVWLVRARPAQGTPSVFAVDARTRQLVRTEIQPEVGVVVHFAPGD